MIVCVDKIKKIVKGNNGYVDEEYRIYASALNLFEI
jgi:hypothetical protein